MSETSDRIIVQLNRFALKVQKFRMLVRAHFYELFPELHPESRRQIDTSAKCPACGIKKPHVVTWNPITRFVIHSCVQCKADFAQSPITPFDKWQKKIEASE